MKRFTHKATLLSVLAITVFVAATLLATSVFSRAGGVSAAGITIRNNSQRDIRHIYLAIGNPDSWGPDQLNGATLSSGSTVVVTAACSGSSVRVIAEDQNGCFVYYNASCDADQTWEITAATQPDCGG